MADLENARIDICVRTESCWCSQNGSSLTQADKSTTGLFKHGLNWPGLVSNTAVWYVCQKHTCC